MIVDTSGSTGMTVRTPSAGGGGATPPFASGQGVRFLDTSKQLLHAILDVLPAHLDALRAKQLINPKPVHLRLWHFDATTTKLADIYLGDASGSGFAQTTCAQLQAALTGLRPGGCTNYDSWSCELRSAVAAAPSALHSVLLVTDGGATSRAQFFASIDAIRTQPGIGFFQVQLHC